MIDYDITNWGLDYSHLLKVLKGSVLPIAALCYSSDTGVITLTIFKSELFHHEKTLKMFKDKCLLMT